MAEKRGGSTGASALTNGTRLHLEKLGRGARHKHARRFSDIVTKLTAKYEGAKNLDEEQRGVIRRIAGMTMTAEKMEASIAKGETIDEEKYGQLADRLNRAYRALELMSEVEDKIDEVKIEERKVIVDGFEIDLRFLNGKLDLTAISDEHLDILYTEMQTRLGTGFDRTRPYRKSEVLVAVARTDPMRALTHPPLTENDGEIETIDEGFDELEQAIGRLF